MRAPSAEIFRGLAAFLAARGWHSAKPSARGLWARYSAFTGADLLFAEDDRQQSESEGRIVVLHDDAQGEAGGVEAPDAWACLDDLIQASVAPARGPILRVRLGRDLLFPFLRDNRKQTPLTRYRYEILAEENPGKRGSASLAMNALRKMLELDAPEGGPAFATRVSLTDPRPLWKARAKVLLALDPQVEAPALFAELVAQHVDALGTGSCGVTQLPLLVRAEQIHALGFQRALAGAVLRATGTPFSDTLIQHMLQLGYLHVYIPNLERLRVDADLDPNTFYLGEILSGAGRDGSVTLGCDQEFVIQQPVFQATRELQTALPRSPLAAPEPQTALPRSPLAAPDLRTLGQRFELDQQLTLYVPDESPGEGEARDSNRDAIGDASGAAEGRLLAGIQGIVKLAPGHVSATEARRLLQLVAMQEIGFGGALLPRTEFRSVVRGVLTGERQRPGNAGFLETAVLASGMVRQYGMMDVAVRSKTVLHWLVASALRDALDALRLTEKPQFLDEILSIANLPYAILRLAVGTSGFARTGEIELAAARMLERYGFVNKASASAPRVLENVLGMLLAMVERCAVLDPTRLASQILGTLLPNGAYLKGLALPQRAFINLNLATWTFDDCDLRSAWFSGCNLSSVSFKDSFLGGAYFGDCVFDSLVSFEGADLSGVKMVNARGLAKALNQPAYDDSLKGSAWTAAYLHDEKFLPGTIASLRTRGCLTTELTIWTGTPPMQMPGNEGRGSGTQDFVATLLYGAWRERHPQDKPEHPDAWRDIPVALHTREPLIVKAADAVEKHAGLWPKGRKPVYIEGCKLGDRSMLLALAEDGAALCAFLDEPTPVWRELGPWCDGHPSRMALSPFPSEQGVLVAVWCERRLSIRALTLPAVPLPVERLTWDETFDRADVPVVKWIAPAAARSPELILGWAGGSLQALRLQSSVDRGRWTRVNLATPVAAPVRAVGYSPRDNVLFATFENGRICGFRYLRETAGEIPLLYSFHTALARSFDIAQINQRGQMLLIGQALGEGSEQELLCMLLNSAGRALAVWPEAKEPYRDPAMREWTFGSNLPENQFAESLSDSVRSDLQQVVLKDKKVIVDPTLRAPVRITLQPSVKGARLPESLTTDIGPRFRTIELTIGRRDGGQMPVAAKQHFNQGELRVDDAGTGISIGATVDFIPYIEEARATVKIAYLPVGGDGPGGAAPVSGQPVSGQRMGPVERTWDVDLEIDWEINPFVADGRWVTGDRFYGMVKPLAECLRALRARKHVVVRACRRAGKTSFLRETARRLLKGEADQLIAGTAEGIDLREPRLLGGRWAGSAQPESAGGRYVSLVVSGESMFAGRSPEQVIADELDALAGREDDDRNLKGLSQEFRGAHLEDRLRNLAAAIGRRGYALPFVLFIDEWGLLKESGYALLVSGMAGQLLTDNVMLCLTSVPADFERPHSSHSSEPYRNIGHWMELGPLTSTEFLDLVRRPLQAPGFSITPAAEALVAELSSLAPDDANKIMHYAFAAAKKLGEKTIDTRHIETDVVRTVLIEKYRAQQGYLFQRLRPENRRRFKEWAAIPAPPWEMGSGRGVPIPLEEEDDPDDLRVFGDAGYRRPYHPGGREDGEAGRFGRFQLWIPRGMTMLFREI